VFDSILDSTKKALGIDPQITDFDVDLTMHINSVLATLNQLGVGPTEGFAIEDSGATWDTFLGDDPTLNNVRSYMYMKVRMMFDPPQTAHLVASMNEQVNQLEWRISVRREGTSWVNPQPVSQLEPEVIIVPSREAWYSEPSS